MSDGPEIRQGMDVVGSDGQHVGTVDRLERGRIRLTRSDDPGHAGEHRFIPLNLIASTEGGQVRLTLAGQQARALAVGGLELGDVVEDGTVPVRGDEILTDRTAGAGTGIVDGGGTGVTDHNEFRGGSAHGGGTRGGGTTRHGHLGSGGGIVDDPNMDPGSARGPRRV